MSRATSPYWIDSSPTPEFPKLNRNLQVDVVVIGAGITGITAAYLLKRAGRRVALLERRRCASIDTGHTTAHLTCVTDERIADLVKNFGEDHARAAWDAGLAAIAQIDEIARDADIDCHFEWIPGYLFAAGEGEEKTLQQEAQQAQELGFDAEFVPSVPFFERPGVRFDGQARFHPRKYLAGLLSTIDGDGSFIFEHTNADEVADEPLSVTAGDWKIRCNDVVVATHNPIIGKAGLVGPTLLQTKLALYTSYVVGGRVPSGTIPDALFWDTADPYSYIRLDSDGEHDYVIYGGQDHKTGQSDDPEKCFENLEASAKDAIRDLKVTHRWSGQVIETNDGLPFIGEMAEHQFAGTGFSGNGMTFGTLTAMMAVDRITGVENPWRKLFDIGRTKIRGGLWDYIKENVDYPYYMIRDRFAGPEGRSLRAVPRGTGKVLKLNGNRVAAYRHPNGSMSVRSATCTHMGCIVQWNAAERTWDCPCHGSRFTPAGGVLSGPAETPLKDVEA